MKRVLVAVIVFLFAPLASAAQTVPVAVMRFVGDDPALSDQVRVVTIGEVENQEGFTPRPLDRSGPRPDEPPDPVLLDGLPYVLTGEYYFDTEDMQHFQLWLWNSDSGSLVYTDELVAEDVEEAQGYLPALVRWVFSKITVRRDEVVTILEVTGPGNEPVPAAAPAAPESGAASETAPARSWFPRLYVGLRLGAALDFQSVRFAGDYEGGIGHSFGGEGALTLEFRPWRRLSFQVEGIFALESFAAYRVNSGDGVHTSDRYMALSLIVPLLVKAPVDLDGFRLAFLGGPAYILSLTRAMGGASYPDKVDLPLGFVLGLDLGLDLGGGSGRMGVRYGELYGSLRAGIDLGLTTVGGTNLNYTRGRITFSLGYKFPVWLW